MDFIEELTIIAGGGDLSAVSDMVNLQKLTISYSYEGVIDFSKLQNLQSCFLGYPKKIDSLFHAKSLIDLSLDEFKYKNFQRISELSNLKSLTLSNSSIDSLKFLQELNLEILELSNCKKIQSFETIAKLSDLKKLIIDGCKEIYDLDFIKNLKKLEWLDLSYNKNLKSILPLINCIKLKELMLCANSTIDDGDLSVLNRLNDLKILMISNRKHYNFKVKEKLKYNVSQGETNFELIKK